MKNKEREDDVNKAIDLIETIAEENDLYLDNFANILLENNDPSQSDLDCYQTMILVEACYRILGITHYIN